jgi:hypothetical protein
MKIVPRTLFAAAVAAATASCDGGGTITALPADPLMAIVGGTSISLREDDCTSLSTSFIQGETVCASVAFDINDDPETTARVEWRTPSGGVLSPEQTVYMEDPGGSKVLVHQLTLSASAPTGTWTVLLCEFVCDAAGQKASANFTVSSPPQSITFEALGDKTYGDDPFAVSASATSGLEVGFESSTLATCSVSGSTVTILAAGTCTIRATQPGNASWAPAPPVDQSFTIDKRPIGVKADAKEKVAGEADPPLTFQITVGALVGTDAFSGELGREAGEDPGVYAILQNTLTAGPNYDLAYQGADLTITAAAPSEEVELLGFLAPIVMDGPNRGAAGQTFPLRFSVFVDGVEQTSTEGIAVAVSSIGCQDGEPIEEIEPSSPGSTALKYVGGFFRLNWKSPAQPGCYEVTVSTGASEISAYFDLR